MLRIIRKSARIGISLPLFGYFDIPAGETPTEKSADTNVSSTESGTDRVINIFKLDEFNGLSPEIATIIHATSLSAFVGMIYGGTIHSRVAYLNFMENNQATAFKDHFEAKKRLQDQVSKSFASGGLKWAWRLSLFTFSYIGISTLISVYRGKNEIREHVAAGTITGILYKFKGGPRAWVVGGGLGLVLGTFAGSATYGLLKLTGVSMDQIRYWNHTWKDNRETRFIKEAKQQIREDKLLIEHEKKKGDAGLETIVLPEEKK